MTKSAIVPIDQLNQPPYASVLCFPNPEKKEVQERIEELQSLGVLALEFSGTSSIFGVKVPVLGKGFVGIVVVAHRRYNRAALKILRQDSGRADLLFEASMLSKANCVKVGPSLIGASKNFLLMQLIEGTLLPNWLEKNQEQAFVKQVLTQLLEQCWRLDEAGIDHGELSKAPKHVIVDKIGEPFIVDFETASVTRRVANVTSICQYLFAGNSSASIALTKTIGLRNPAKLVNALRTYKKERDRQNFEALLQICLS